MSFDVHLLAFDHGEAGSRAAGGVRDLLLQHGKETGELHVLVGYGDGEADVYGLPAEGEPLTSLTFNHVNGEDPWELIVQVAHAADLVIVPAGCPVCLVSDRQRPHLPEEIAGARATVVRDGRGLLRAIRTS